MPGTSIGQSNEGAINIPVTTGELSDSPVTSTVESRDIRSDIQPPPMEAPKTVAVPVQAEGEEAAMQNALGELDQVASQAPTSNQEFREENSLPAESVDVGNRTADAVNGSLTSGNFAGLEQRVQAPIEVANEPPIEQASTGEVNTDRPTERPAEDLSGKTEESIQAVSADRTDASPDASQGDPAVIERAQTMPSADLSAQEPAPRELYPDQAPEVSELTTQEDFKQFVDNFLARKPELEVRPVAGVGVDRDSFLKATTLSEVQKEVLFLREIGKSDAKLTSIIKSYIEAEAITGEVK